MDDILRLIHILIQPWSILIALVAVLVAIPIYRITFHPLAKFPGPTSWAITRIPWHRSLHRGRLHLDLQDLHNQYGEVVRIAPGELSYIHPDAHRDIHTTRPGHKIIPKNDIWFRVPETESKMAASLLGHDEVDHAKMRRAFNGAFTDAGVKEMLPVVMKHTNLMINQLNKVSERAQAKGEQSITVDLVEWLNFTTFDISGELSFGEGFGSIEAEKAHPWVDFNTQFGKGVSMLASMNFLYPLNKMLAFVVPKEVVEKSNYHKELTKEKVGKRLSEGKGKADFIGAVEKHNEECEAKGQLDRIARRADLDLNMSILVFAGSETTSSALSSIFRYLLQDKKAEDRLISEMLKRFKSEEEITSTQLNEWPYLDAVISEGMRLGPAVAIGVPRMMPPGGEEICGTHVPGQTLVSVAPYAAYRSSKNFVKPNIFIPERFLPSERTWEDNFEVFQPFNQGRHKCLGYRLAWVMMRVLLVRLLYTFDMKLDEKVRDYGQQQTFIFWEKEPLRIHLTKRKRSSA